MPGHLGGCFGCNDAEPLYRWSNLTGNMKVLCRKTNTEIVEHFGTCAVPSTSLHIKKRRIDLTNEEIIDICKLYKCDHYHYNQKKCPIEDKFCQYCLISDKDSWPLLFDESFLNEEIEINIEMSVTK